MVTESGGGDMEGTLPSTQTQADTRECSVLFAHLMIVAAVHRPANREQGDCGLIQSSTETESVGKKEIDVLHKWHRFHIPSR